MNRCRRSRHLYARIEKLETKLRDLEALTVTGDARAEAPETVDKVKDLTAELVKRKQQAFDQWGA